MENIKTKIVTLLILSVLIVLSSLSVGVFWDNVLFASKIGNHLFENGIFNWDLPTYLDSGHPPFLATLMALGWTLFGKSLSVSHWIMLPFVFGLLWQLYVFVSSFVENKYLQIWAFLLVLADPTLLSQLVLISPEVNQLFFFFLALNATFKNNTYYKVIALVFLGIVSFRGMMLCAGIFIIDLLIHLIINKKSIKSFFTKRIFFEYLIGALPAVIFITWSLTSKGWLLTHQGSPWASSWNYVTLNDLLRNILVLVQRYIDFGRLAVFILVIIGLYMNRKTINKNIVTLLLIFLFSTFIIVISSLMSTNTMGHRYFIPSYLTLALISFLLIQQFKFRKIIYVGLLASLISGNLLVYPDAFSQGWDSSLAHLPYWNLRKNAIEFMDENEIDINKTATFFPNYTAIDNIELNGDKRSFINFSGKEHYVLYSNVYNLKDEDLELLHQNYDSIKIFETCRVRVEIFKKK